MAKHPRQQPESSSLTSATPQKLPKKQQALFRDVLTILNSSKVPFAVSGAIALQQHTGICRNTKDLDIFLAAKDGERALACLTKNGFNCEVRDPVWLAKAHRDNYFVDLITGMSNAAITVEDSWMEHSHPGEVRGVPVRLLAPEELLVSKLFVTRREVRWRRHRSHRLCHSRQAGLGPYFSVCGRALGNFAVVVITLPLRLSWKKRLRASDDLARLDLAVEQGNGST